MDFQSVNLLNVRLNMVSGNLLPMTADDSSFPISWKIYSFLIWLLEIVQVSTLIPGCFLVPREKALKDGLIGFAISLEVFFIVIRIHTRRGLVQHLIQKLNNILRLEDETMRNIVTVTLNSMDIPLKICWSAGVMSIIFWCSSSYGLIFEKDFFFYVDYKMPVIYAKEPVSSNLFVFGSFIITISSIYIFTKKIGTDTYMIHIILLVTAQYRYTALKLSAIFHGNALDNHSNLSKKGDYLSINDCPEKQIKTLCRYHNELVHITLMLKELLSINLSIIYLNNVFRFCAISFMVLVIPSLNVVEGSGVLMYACGGIIQLYILCFCVQQFLDASTEITDKAFHEEWYKYGASIKRIFMIMIMVNNFGCKLSKFEKFSLSLPSFMTILNQSYSIALLLLKTN